MYMSTIFGTKTIEMLYRFHCSYILAHWSKMFALLQSFVLSHTHSRVYHMAITLTWWAEKAGIAASIAFTSFSRWTASFLVTTLLLHNMTSAKPSTSCRAKTLPVIHVYWNNQFYICYCLPAHENTYYKIHVKVKCVILHNMFAILCIWCSFSCIFVFCLFVFFSSFFHSFVLLICKI